MVGFLADCRVWWIVDDKIMALTAYLDTELARECLRE
jgi:hypothetical protein